MDITFEHLIEWFRSLNLPYGSIICTLLMTVFSFVVMVIQLKKFKLYKNETKEYDLKYRKEDYQSKKGFAPFKEHFKCIVPIYDLNSAGDDLVVVGTKDLQELVQSSRECGLDIVFEKYGSIPVSIPPEVKSKTDEPFDATDIRDDFEFLSDMYNDIEELRVRYNLPDASPDDLFKHINTLKAKLDKDIQDTLSKQVKKEDENNG